MEKEGSRKRSMMSGLEEEEVKREEEEVQQISPQNI